MSRHGDRGRVGLFELLEMNDSLKEALMDGGSRARIADLARSGGMRLLREDGWAKVRDGLTTVEEVLACHSGVIEASDAARHRVSRFSNFLS